MRADRGHVETGRVQLRPEADVATLVAAQIEAEEEAVGHSQVVGRHGLAATEEQRAGAVHLDQLAVGQRGPPDDETQLVQRQPLLDLDRERQGHDLEVERSAVAVGDLVEPVAAVGDDTGEHVESTRRALGVGLRPQALGQGKVLGERDEVWTVRLEDCSPAQVELVDDQRSHLAVDRVDAGQEAAPQPECPWPEPQVEARRLHTVFRDLFASGVHVAERDGLADELRRQDAACPVA